MSSSFWGPLSPCQWVFWVDLTVCWVISLAMIYYSLITHTISDHATFKCIPMPWRHELGGHHCGPLVITIFWYFSWCFQLQELEYHFTIFFPAYICSSYFSASVSFLMSWNHPALQFSSTAAPVNLCCEPRVCFTPWLRRLRRREDGEPCWNPLETLGLWIIA